MGKHERGAVTASARDGRGRHRWVLIGLAAALGLMALMAIPAVALTERPQFCTSCHEMQPYYDAFELGPHRNVSCVDCHVDGGIPARVSHKMVALKEVLTHFTTSPKFPLASVAVPDYRCKACHANLRVTASGFDHKVHVGQLGCKQCHKSAGHDVTLQALAQAGIISTAAQLQMASSPTVLASNATTSAVYAPDSDRVSGHKTTACTSCHDLSTFKCSNCHTAPHVPRGECATCHRADPRAKAWAFAHPTSTACEACHTTTKHPARGPCATCHQPGTKWTFVHPDGNADCSACHPKPAAATHAVRTKCAACHDPGVAFAKTSHTHKRGDVCLTCHDAPAAKHTTAVTTCGQCHKTGVSWAFSHPQRADCSACHRPPNHHYATTCARCHKPSTPWKQAKVDHSVVGTNCATCHTAPSGHSGRGSACATCHRQAGASWAFSHSTSLACASCHQPPANHFGTACASCHKHTTPFAKATFTHPSVGMNPNSMACTSCHPNGYTTHTCAPCHKGTPGGG
jgi:nitrate/TMAO reductase-like tetraheme cytochrome c subunit